MRLPAHLRVTHTAINREAGVVEFTVEVVSPIHQCPPDGGSGIMPCCGRTPFEVPRSDRLTVDAANVTCDGGAA